MTTHFSRLKVPYPKDYGHPDDCDGCWKVYTVWQKENPASCTTRADVQALESRQDKIDARSTFVALLNRAVTGQDFGDLYEIKKCHVAHTFKYTSSRKKTTEIKIFRIWGSGKIRTYFLYLEGKQIVLLKTLAKRTNTLTVGQEKELEDLSTLVLGCVEENAFETREK